MLEWFGLPQGSAHSAEIDYVVDLTHWLMLVLCVGWGLFFVYTLIRFRQGANPVANHHGIKAVWSKYLEGLIVLAEVVLLVVFSIPAYNARVAAFPAEPQSTVVRVVAEQFAWNVHYPGPDGVFGRTDIRLVNTDNPLGLDRSEAAAKDDLFTINEFNMPVDKPVIVHLTSKDVIHSFGLPQMRVKQDARPRAQRLVHADDDRGLGDRLLAALRPGALPDARLLHRAVAGRLQRLGAGTARADGTVDSPTDVAAGPPRRGACQTPGSRAACPAWNSSYT